jgi:chromatin remodeling complex protein RSC6
MPKKKKTNAAFLKMAQAPLKPSPQLAEVLGSAAPISRPQVAKKVWAYIKKTAIQALDQLDPVLPLSPGRAERHGFEYYRLCQISPTVPLDLHGSSETNPH